MAYYTGEDKTTVSITKACEILGVSKSYFYHKQEKGELTILGPVPPRISMQDMNRLADEKLVRGSLVDVTEDGQREIAK